MGGFPVSLLWLAGQKYVYDGLRDDEKYKAQY